MSGRPSRRSLLAACAALPLTGALSACGGSGGSVGTGRTTRLTFWSALRGSQQVVDEFNRTHDRVQVDFNQIPGGDQGGYAKLSNAARAGNAPDVATLEYPQVPGYAIDGVARDITALVPDRLKAKLLPQALGLTTFEGRVFSGLHTVLPSIVNIALWSNLGYNMVVCLVLAAVMVPQTVLALPLYLMASGTGLVNTFWAVFVPVLFNPFGVYLGRIFSQGYVPDEVLEAARVDGAGELTTYARVSLRMLGPGLVTVFLFQLTSIWNNFFLPMVMLSDQHLYPVSLGLYSWNSSATVSPEYYPVVITGSLLAVLPLILAFVLLQRFWRSGLTAGAVK
ncbi:extracellular solute-binding protein [Streptomyces sp. NPDC058001]|uniref:extracellular solute-binding protein n=1 Tax=Streptomyces sp. NPDC058001 TaxID=3346300 RepID=UPI0036E46BD2